MKDEVVEFKQVVSDIRWYGISMYTKEIKRPLKTNDDVEVERIVERPVEMPDHLGNEIKNNMKQYETPKYYERIILKHLSDLGKNPSP